MKKLEYSSMFVGDLHGRIYQFEKAIESFEKTKVDKLVFMGDYVDGGKTDVEILHLVNEVIRYKMENEDKVVLLWGNHEMQYVYPPDYKCGGFRESMANDLYAVFHENLGLFHIAWRNGDLMASHAGILSDWMIKYNDRIGYYEDKFKIDRIDKLDILLDKINTTSDRWMLNTVNPCRGGVRSGVGGPLWADMSEIVKGGCMHRYTHVVGHNKVKEITQYIGKGGPTVIFTDCLGSKSEFLTLNN